MIRPENGVLTGSRLSELEDIESWIEAIVTRWRKQHGPIPKMERGAPRDRMRLAPVAKWLETKAGKCKKTRG